MYMFAFSISFLFSIIQSFYYYCSYHYYMLFFLICTYHLRESFETNGPLPVTGGGLPVTSQTWVFTERIEPDPKISQK